MYYSHRYTFYFYDYSIFNLINQMPFSITSNMVYFITVFLLALRVIRYYLNLSITISWNLVLSASVENGANLNDGSQSRGSGVLSKMRNRLFHYFSVVVKWPVYLIIYLSNSVEVSTQRMLKNYCFDHSFHSPLPSSHIMQLRFSCLRQK